MKRRTFLANLMLIAIGSSLMACKDGDTHARLGQGAKVTALGDSLTFGMGASAGNDYPSLLAQKTGWQITNAGINGDTTEHILLRLDTVIKNNPQLVLLGIGGNDVLRRINPAITEQNLNKIIKQLKNAGIEVVLIAQPYFTVGALLGRASDNPIYQKVAQEQNIPLFDKAWSDILSDNRLKSDQIHANDAGYAQFSEKLYKFLQKLGYV